MAKRRRTNPVPRTLIEPGLVLDAVVQFDDSTAAKPRPVVIVSAVGDRATVRPFYTRSGFHHRTFVARSAINGLDHDSYLSATTKIVTVPQHPRLRGYLHDDPFGDLYPAAA